MTMLLCLGELGNVFFAFHFFLLCYQVHVWLQEMRQIRWTILESVCDVTWWRTRTRIEECGLVFGAVDLKEDDHGASFKYLFQECFWH